MQHIDDLVEGVADPAIDPSSDLFQKLEMDLLVGRANLPGRSQEMLDLYLQDHTQAEIAQQFNLTESRVSQIMKETTEQIRRAI